MKLVKSAALLVGLSVIAGCGSAEAQHKAQQQAAQQSQPQVRKQAQPQAPQPRQQANDLAAYADHYPFDEVNGVTFRHNPLVVAGVRGAITDPTIRAAALENDDVVDTPILQLSEGRLYARSFDPKGGGSTNWAILITADGGKTAVCFSDDAVYDEGKSTWYYEGEVAFVQDGPCPGEKDDVEARFGAWPVGPIPS